MTAERTRSSGRASSSSARAFEIMSIGAVDSGPGPAGARFAADEPTYWARLCCWPWTAGGRGRSLFILGREESADCNALITFVSTGGGGRGRPLPATAPGGTTSGSMGLLELPVSATTPATRKPSGVEVLPLMVPVPE